MENNVVIRKPLISDLEDIVHINRICLPENYPVAYFIELIKSWHETSRVAIVNNKLVGYNIVRIERSSISPWRPRMKSKGHIISVAVLPEYRRRGIGTQLIDEVLETLKTLNNITKVTLEVRETNTSAINLYKELNFISAKVLSRYYSDGENALLMELSIS
ncbi:MAG: GNAT family N-acetyltransferase [Candidatus Kariarchaeaceae archaeon]|jgi:ribosomal-protein-alanine N-acetyltransferase